LSLKSAVSTRAAVLELGILLGAGTGAQIENQ